MLPKEFEKALEQEWFVQGFNANPLFIHHAGWSGFPMKQQIGYGYNSFLCMHKEGYGEVSYNIEDLNRVWAETEKRLAEDPQYLVRLRERAEEDKEKACAAALEKTPDDLWRESDEVVFDFLQRGSHAMIQTISVSHVIEAVSYGIEPRFKMLLKKELRVARRENEFNDFFAALTIPSQFSFVTKEEQELAALKELVGHELETALEKHVAQWKWATHTYTRPRPLTVDICKERMQEAHTNAMSIQEVLQKKEQYMNAVPFSDELKHLVELIDFTTVWQDDRKAFILQGIELFSNIMKVVAERTSIDVELLYYMSVHDIQAVKSLGDVAAMHEQLAQRQKGSVFVLSEQGVAIAGEQYAEFMERWKAKHQKDLEESQNEFRGSIANTGTAQGPVRICMNLDDMAYVQSGDILVTSMTRPEFMPALKKAAAIVTDEGGITSHAAIVSRELGIPAVIGTKVATKVLKDGMMVEVRANHGFVRIIDTE